jgi:hypothetical protein
MTTKEKTTADGVPHSKLKQPSCPWCGMDTRCGSGWHVEGFREQGLCGSKWFPDFEGGHLEGREQSTACKEIARLKAQLSQAERVVVPELTEVDVRTALMSNAIDVDVEGVTPRLNRILTSRAHSVPASRVLKDGEVAIQESERNVLLVLERYARKHGPESIQYAIDTLDALRAQGKEKL